MTRRLWLGRSRCGVQLPWQFHSVAVAHAPRTKRIDANQEETRAGLRSHTVTIGAGNHWRDSVRSKPRTRFFLVGVDSFRTWRVRDCNGMKLPRELDTASTTPEP